MSITKIIYVLKSPLVYIKYKLIFMLAQVQKSTASQIIINLAKQNISTSDIQPSHLSHIYSDLWPRKNSPITNGCDEALAALKNVDSHVSDDWWAVIVETRCHKYLPFVIKNMINETGLRVQLYHGTQNIDFILKSPIKKLIDEGMVYLTPLGVKNLMAKGYNSLFVSKVFWSSIMGRKKIVVFQTDSIICSKTLFTLNDFIEYDYIGARWATRKRPNGLILDGGVGGFSIRDYAKSIEVIERFPADDIWQGGEDDYFSFFIELIGGSVGSNASCNKFCTQESFDENSFAAHQITQLNGRAIEKFLKYSSEAKFMLD